MYSYIYIYIYIFININAYCIYIYIFMNYVYIYIHQADIQCWLVVCNCLGMGAEVIFGGWFPSNVARENHPFTVIFAIKTFVHGGFTIAMLPEGIRPWNCKKSLGRRCLRWQFQWIAPWIAEMVTPSISFATGIAVLPGYAGMLFHVDWPDVV